jgi:hypothetical protein
MVIYTCSTQFPVEPTINFPDIEPTIPYVRKDTFDRYTLNDDAEYKVLLYTDSAGCTNCRLRIHIWKTYLKELSDKVNFLFYFHPKNEDDLMNFFKHEKFAYPVYIDSDNKLDKLNNLSLNIQYQCFLLNKDNKVIAAGNPVHNYKVWELYKRIICGKVLVKIPVTVIEPKQTEIVMENLKEGKTYTAIFVLKNIGDQPLIIRNVETLCKCMIPEWDKQLVSTGKTAKIKISVTPDSPGFFNKLITVYCNTDKGQIILTVKGSAL